MGTLDALVKWIRGWLAGLYDSRRTGEAIAPGRVPLGRTGERLAERHLRRSGYRLLARNFRAAGAEIDLVAAEGDTIVFVEVKTRRDLKAGQARRGG